MAEICSQGSDHRKFLHDFGEQLCFIAKLLSVFDTLLTHHVSQIDCHPFQSICYQILQYINISHILPRVAVLLQYTQYTQYTIRPCGTAPGPGTAGCAARSSERSSLASSFITTSMSVTDLTTKALRRPYDLIRSHQISSATSCYKLLQAATSYLEDLGRYI